MKKLVLILILLQSLIISATAKVLDLKPIFKDNYMSCLITPPILKIEQGKQYYVSLVSKKKTNEEEEFIFKVEPDNLIVKYQVKNKIVQSTQFWQNNKKIFEVSLNKKQLFPVKFFTRDWAKGVKELIELGLQRLSLLQYFSNCKKGEKYKIDVIEIGSNDFKLKITGKDNLALMAYYRFRLNTVSYYTLSNLNKKSLSRYGKIIKVNGQIVYSDEASLKLYAGNDHTIRGSLDSFQFPLYEKELPMASFSPTRLKQAIRIDTIEKNGNIDCLFTLFKANGKILYKGPWTKKINLFEISDYDLSEYKI